MPGMIFIDNFKVNGKLQAGFMCDKCRKIFAFEHGEKLHCPYCGGRAYPMNIDPTPVEKSKKGVGGSRLIIPCGDPTSKIG
jgi:DNA-directed RNA polymerase subunit RPC12/RpoP